MSLDITDEARIAWEQWYNRKPKSIHATRLDTIGFRLMCLMALTMDEDAIGVEVIEIVTAILDYEYRIRVLTDPINADNKIASLEQKIRNVLSVNSNHWLSERVLRQKTHADRTGLFFFDRAVNNLHTISAEIQIQTTGRKRSFRLAPDPESYPPL